LSATSYWLALQRVNFLGAVMAKNEKVTKPEELVRVYDLLLQVTSSIFFLFFTMVFFI
jgi:hypothetical protein